MAGEISISELGDRRDAENIVYLITDGVSNINEGDTIQAAQDLKDGGARIITIGINMDNYSGLERMASAETDVFRMSSFNDLENEIENVVRTTCRNGNEIQP